LFLNALSANHGEETLHSLHKGPFYHLRLLINCRKHCLLSRRLFKVSLRTLPASRPSLVST